ncbi:hypothetical protein GQ457_01G020940 [Hibiscus cannabinus]
MLTIESTTYTTMVRIFYANDRCIVDGDITIEIESYIIGRTLLLDVATLTNHLGLEDEGVVDETTQIPFVHALSSSVSVVDAHDRILHLLFTWWFRPFGIDFSLDLASPLIYPINEKSLRKSKFQLINGEWIRDPNAQEGDDNVPPPPVDAPPAPMAPPPNDALLDYLEGKFFVLDTRALLLFA